MTQKREGRGISKSRGPHNKNDRSKSRFESQKCGECLMKGHYIKQYRILKRKLAEKKGKCKVTDTTVVMTVYEDILIFCDDDQVNVIRRNSNWTIDSSGSYHVTPHKHSFPTYTKGDFNSVRIENQDSCKVVVKRNIVLETNKRCQLILKIVRYILNMHLNIVSMGQLDYEDYYNTQDGGKCKLVKKILLLVEERK